MSKQTTGQRIAGKYLDSTFSVTRDELAESIDRANKRVWMLGREFEANANPTTAAQVEARGRAFRKAFPGKSMFEKVKLPKPARKPKCRTCKGEGTLSVGGADGIKCWKCGKRKAKKRSKS